MDVDAVNPRSSANWELIAIQSPLVIRLRICRQRNVRVITAGHGIFIVKGDEERGYDDIELEAGDVISVPENTAHFFTLMDDK